MADLSITAANVLASDSATPVRRGIAGATITAGQVLYVDTAADNVLKLADADVLASAAVAGIALNGAATGQPVEYVEADPDFTPGATTVAGTTYYLSTTAGAICPVGDLATGDFVTVLGIGLASNGLHLRPVVSATAIPA
jgi:hypothetical protein